MCLSSSQETLHFCSRWTNYYYPQRPHNLKKNISAFPVSAPSGVPEGNKFLNSKKSLSSPITLIFFSFAFPLLLVFRQNFPTVLFGEERHFKSLSAGRMTFSVIPWSPPSYSCCASGLCPWTTASLLLPSELSVGSSGEKVLGATDFTASPWPSPATQVRWRLMSAQCSCGPNVLIFKGLIAYNFSEEEVVVLFQGDMQRVRWVTWSWEVCPLPYRNSCPSI